jgi:plasmid stabilization system protein ParE
VSHRLRVSRRAARQVRDASAWWTANRDKAPAAFADDLAEAFELVASHPHAGEVVEHVRIPAARRLLLRRTRYQLYYVVEEDVVIVLALWHSSRGRGPDL